MYNHKTPSQLTHFQRGRHSAHGPLHEGRHAVVVRGDLAEGEAARDRRSVPGGGLGLEQTHHEAWGESCDELSCYAFVVDSGREQGKIKHICKHMCKHTTKSALKFITHLLPRV